MKLKRNRLFLYPVLHTERDDYIDSSTFTVDVKAFHTTNKVKINISLIIKDRTIEDYINEGKFIKTIHVECPLTKYRKIYTLNPNVNTIDIEIDSRDLNDVVEVSPMIISNYNGIYRNINFQDIYREYKFEIEKGNLIAFDDTRFFKIEKEKTEYKDMESVFLVNRTSKAKQINIDVTSSDKIIIDLPEKTYDNYYSLDNDINRDVSIQILIYPAVLKALEMLYSEESISDVKDKKWFITFKKQLKKHNCDLDDSFLTDTNEKYILAQKLLERPIERAFERLQKINIERK